MEWPLEVMRSQVNYLANISGLELEEINSSRLKLVLVVLCTHKLQFARVAFTAKDLDEDIGVCSRSTLLARLY